MASAKQLLTRLERISLQQTTITEVMARPEEMPELNREQMYREGQTSTGAKLKRYKRERYARAKNRMNPLPGYGNPDFYVTGAFHRGITIQEQAGRIRITSTDRKTPFLLKRDPEVFGLTGENLNRYRKQLFPRIMRNINRQVKGR
jgi:hypothetical protein